MKTFLKKKSQEVVTNGLSIEKKNQIKNNWPIKRTIEYLEKYIYVWSLKVDASNLKLISPK